MSDLLALRSAAAGLLPTTWGALPTPPSVHEGEVREVRPSLPWLVWGLTVPDRAHRGESGQATASRVTFSVTVAGRSEAEVGLILDMVARAVDGVQPVVSGWSCGALILHQPPRSWPEQIDLPGASTRGFVAVTAWRFTVTPLPAP